MTKMEEEEETGREGGLSCLIDSVKRNAGDVNGWTLLFPRSGASGSAMGRQPVIDRQPCRGGGETQQVSPTPHSAHSFKKVQAFPTHSHLQAPQ